MPTPRSVFGESTRHRTPQSFSTVLVASGVAPGTTLHKAAPSMRAPPTNFRSGVLAPRRDQVVVGTLADLITRSGFANPKWVFVLPISRSRSMKESFFQGYVSADNSFQVAVLSAQQQRAIIAQGFRSATDLTVAGADNNVMADGCAMLLPFISNCRELAGAHTIIIVIQFPEYTCRKLGPRYRLARFQFERGRERSQFRRKISRAQIDIHTNAQDDVFNPVQLGVKFGENAGRFLSANQKVIRPLDFRLQASLSLNGATERNGRGDRQLSYFLRSQIRTQQDGEPKPLFCRRRPLAPEPSPAFSLRLGKDNNAFFQPVARKLLHDVVGRSGFLEDSNVASDHFRSAKTRKQIIGMQSIRRAQQSIAQVRAGFDVVTEGPQILDACPDGGTANANFLGQLGAADAAVAFA